MNLPRNTLSLRNRRRIAVFNRALLGALAAMALTACGGGDTEMPEVAQAPQGATLVSTVTMTKVSFTNVDGQALTGFLFQDSAAVQRNAAVVMMHGCAGVWSNGVESKEAQPPIKALSHIHKRWGESLARAGYTGLLVDSFTSRALTNECNNGSAGLNEAVERPKDAAAGRAWLLASNLATAGRIALLGWSNGASAVMASMDQSHEGTPGSKPFKEAFAFYPGCGLINEFGGNASAPDKTTWLPYAPVTIQHAATDPLYTDGKCSNRVNVAIAMGAGNASGNAVAMTVHSGARHSFDQIDIAKAIVSPYTTADRDAQTAADAAVMDRLSTILSN